jgi:hypothetical protein
MKSNHVMGSQGKAAKIPESYCMPKTTKRTKFPG